MTGIQKRIIAGLLLAGLAIAAMITAACNAPFGFGETIDWEPPVLTLDGSRLRYVRQGAELTGTVTDNVAVDRVILRDNTGAELFRARLLPNNRWSITLEFDAADNGKRIMAEIVAYDKAGNSGETSIAAITLIVDTNPPMIQNIWIQRTPTKTAYLKPLADLQELEQTDPRGDNNELNDDANHYQNGWFTINAAISEMETSIKDVVMDIFDSRDFFLEKPVVKGLERDDGAPLYSPRWTIKEEDILAGGDFYFPNYTDNYYENGERYYYQIIIRATDQSLNESSVEQQEYFCMWEKGDEPKGLLDMLATGSENDEGRIAVSKGMPLPVIFFDDDVMIWAYADLFTKAQWDARSGADNDAKLENLMQDLRSGATVKNWRVDAGTSGHDDADAIIKNRLGSTLEQPNAMLEYVKIGSGESDYGDYVLFTLVADAKLDPHNGTGPRDTNKTRWKGRTYNISIVDDNFPLIVFDTVDTSAPDYDSDKHSGYDDILGASTGNSPEENTFPTLTYGRYFTINGYTLREDGLNKTTDPFASNGVTAFRMAWIPYNLIRTWEKGENDLISEVEKSLRNEGLTGSEVPYPTGVQHWNLSLLDGTRPIIGVDSTGYAEREGNYRKQVFRKTFDVLHGPDDTTNVIGGASAAQGNNFTYGSTKENEIKTFVFCAIDNMEHVTFRTIRLTANKTLPVLTVYDISSLIDDNALADKLTGKKLPNLYDYDANNNGTIEKEERVAYQAALARLQEEVYGAFKDIAYTSSDFNLEGLETESFHTYTRNTVVKYWVEAKSGGSIAIESVTMQDITFSDPELRTLTGYNDKPTNTNFLSYFELLPEVTQRVFLFTARDMLGNETRIQRTAAVTSAAYLTHISSPQQNGTYGITADTGETIELQAFFSGIVQYTGTPQLNVSYMNGGTLTIKSLPVDETKTPPLTDQLYLSFPFEVEAGFSGQLKTMYNGMDIDSAGEPTTISMGGDANEFTDRPLKLNGASIIDATRGEAAFTPGNSMPGSATAMPNWTSARYSLQDPTKRNNVPIGKKIELDGKRPLLTALTVSRGADVLGSGISYFKDGETISFTLTADKPIRTAGGGNPRIQFNVTPAAGGSDATYYANYQRPSGANTMVFSIPTSNFPANVTEGTIAALSLNYGDGLIIDDNRNKLLVSPSLTPPTLTLPTGVIIRIDNKPPPTPTATTAALSGAPTTVGGVLYYSEPPTLTITALTTTQEPWGSRRWYSLNGGLEWHEYTDTPPVSITAGEYTLATRYTDTAGNIGAVFSRQIYVKDTFPKLIGITAAQPDGFYKAGDTITFNLAFEDDVYAVTPGNVSITLFDWNRATAAYNAADVDNHRLTLTGAAQTAANASSTVSFVWSITGKELRNGMYVKEVNFTGLRDRFGNNGSAGIADLNADANTAPDIVISSNNTPNLSGKGLKVDCVAPTVTTRAPVSMSDQSPNTNISTSVSSDNTTIKLTFREPVQLGTGTITIKPHGNYLIPPVFENETYYDGDGAKITGFYDIYNSSLLDAADRTALTAGSSMSNLTLDERTGQSAGPYIRTTHGLIEGMGYSGAYTVGDTVANAAPVAGDNHPSAGGAYMIPDTATKWVLDYRYSIDNSANTQYVDISNNLQNANTNAVPAIRTALTKAKFRWQELDVVFAASVNGNEVTITLNDTLEKGLQWDVCYPAGTFMDMAGNIAPAENCDASGNINVTANGYWFWSGGVQTPVIRVNRKSFDARTANWEGGTVTGNVKNRTYGVPVNRGGPGGWGIGDFNTVHYRIETETPDAQIRYGAINGTPDNGGGISVVTGATLGQNWAVTVPNAAANTAYWNATTNGTANIGNTRGRWIRPNLIYRSNGDNPDNYRVLISGVDTTRSFMGTYRGFRSYNKDATPDDLSNLILGTTINGSVSSGTALNFTYNYTEASKNYVVARARVNHLNDNYAGTTGYISDRGYEGVFRTVVALYQRANFENRAERPTAIEGSNIKNGMPSIPGFPLRDAEETGDNRFIKLFYSESSSPNSQPRQLYWVSTEIVSEWYLLKHGGSNPNNNGASTHQNVGETNNYLMSGYGDLTFGNDVTGY